MFENQEELKNFYVSLDIRNYFYTHNDVKEKITIKIKLMKTKIKKTSKEELFKIVKSTILEITDLEEFELHENTNLILDLAIEPIDMGSIVNSLEEKLEVEALDSEWNSHVETVADIVEFVYNKLQQ